MLDQEAASRLVSKLLHEGSQGLELHFLQNIAVDIASLSAVSVHVCCRVYVHTQGQNGVSGLVSG